MSAMLTKIVIRAAQREKQALGPTMEWIGVDLSSPVLPRCSVVPTDT
jgi:hypothetical protein